MNAFVGEKIAIVSHRPQTTRNRILGVMAREACQIVFVDTPGIHKPRNMLGEYMVKAADSAKDGVDAVMAVVDGQLIGSSDMEVLRSLAALRCPRFIAVNKLDLVDREHLIRELAKLNELGFDQIVPVSALKRKNLDTLEKLLIEAMPEGPKYFPDDMITDQPERTIIAEIVREKALRCLDEEIPHGVGVEMLSIERMGDHLIEIHANLYCEKASHKSIIIGKQGALLGRIGSMARADIERLLDEHVMLKLWVKVRENWRNRVHDLRALGYSDKDN